MFGRNAFFDFFIGLVDLALDVDGFGSSDSCTFVVFDDFDLVDLAVAFDVDGCGSSDSCTFVVFGGFVAIASSSCTGD